MVRISEREQAGEGLSRGPGRLAGAGHEARCAGVDWGGKRGIAVTSGGSTVDPGVGSRLEPLTLVKGPFFFLQTLEVPFYSHARKM